MKLTTIQLHEVTKRKLEQKKIHPRESYDAVISRILESETTLSLEEAFRESDQIKLKRSYTTDEVIALTHAYRRGM